jgi:SAM-dependent methyltransferase
LIRRRLRWAADRARFPGKSRLYGAGWSAYQRWVMGRNRGGGEDPLVAGPHYLALPPRRLRMLTVARPDVDFFIWSGYENFEQLRSMLAAAGVDPGSLGSVLDFGCGCGRIARWWPSVGEPDLHGCDRNAELAAWCDANLPMQAGANGLAPPLPYAGGRFDLVYALSIFTHLPEQLQRRWIAELTRVLRPGGHLWLTLSGEAHLDRLSPAERAAFARGEPVTQFGEVPGSNLCAAFHPPGYVNGTLLSGLEIVAHVPGARDGAGVTLSQDAYLARLPAEATV